MRRAYGFCKLKGTMTDHNILCVVAFLWVPLHDERKTCYEKAGNIMKLDLLIKDMKT